MLPEQKVGICESLKRCNIVLFLESTLQDKIDEINILLLSDKYGEFGREGDSPWTLKYPRKVWRLVILFPFNNLSLFY